MTAASFVPVRSARRRERDCTARATSCVSLPDGNLELRDGATTR